MHIEIFRGLNQKLPNASVNVVIDVLRAFTTAHVAFERGVESVVLERNVEAALEYQKKHPGVLLIGEIGGYKIPSFDIGNSPYDLEHLSTVPKEVVLKTTNGVEAVFTSLNARWVLVCGLVNAKATAEHILNLRQNDPSINSLNLLASCEKSDEDLACAEFIRSLVLGEKNPTFAEASERVLKSQAALKFKRAEHPDFKREDLTICAEERNLSFPIIAEGNCPIKLRRVPHESVFKSPHS